MHTATKCPESINHRLSRRDFCMLAQQFRNMKTGAIYRLDRPCLSCTNMTLTCELLSSRPAQAVDIFSGIFRLLLQVCVSAAWDDMHINEDPVSYA
jgi:hypothetical protein